MDLEDPMKIRILSFAIPTRFEYDLDNILARITVDQLRHSVLDRLVVFEEGRVLEYLAA